MGYSYNNIFVIQKVCVPTLPVVFGVIRFFLWLKNEYPECLSQIKKNQTVSDIKTDEEKGVEIDSYSIDLNAIIHPIAQEIYGYGDNNKNKPRYGAPTRFRQNEEKKTVFRIPDEKEVFKAICQKIEELRSIVKPRKQLFLAIDGIAGLSKQTQQRQRRFASVKEKTEEQLKRFDSNNITVGTAFMYNFARYLHFFIHNQLKSNPGWRNLEVICSNEKVPGEGEHKIIRYLDNLNSSWTYCIDSPDADLIMLTLGLHKLKQLYIIRKNAYDNIQCEFFLVDVSQFRQSLISKFRWSSITQVHREISSINDFIMVTFFMGNDFLPHIPSLEISNDGFFYIMEIYPAITMEYGHFTYYNEDGLICLNMKSLTQLFRHMARLESDIILKKFVKGGTFEDPLVSQCITETPDKHEKVSIKKLDFEKHRRLFYTHKLSGLDHEKICYEYLKGILFVLRYYLQGMPDYLWTYPLHKSPFFTELSQYSFDFDGEMEFPKTQPLTPFEQLLAVLPPKSAQLLPTPYRCLLTDVNSPIIDFYPEHFETDIDGKKQAYEGHVILPFIDVKRLKDAYQKITDQLSPEEIKRNTPGKTTRYILRNNEVAMNVVNISTVLQRKK